MRTTITLDPDVAAKLKAATRRTGRPFKEVVNDTLRRGLAVAAPKASHPPFRIEARDLGASRPGLQMDDVGGLLEAVEGPGHR